MNIYLKKTAVLLALLVLGIWLIYRPATLKPESLLRQRSVMQAVAPAGLQVGAGGEGALVDVVNYEPVPAVTINLTDIPVRAYDGNSQYDRWLRGEIDLDEADSIISAAEAAALQNAAMNFSPDSRVQQMVSGPGLLSPIVGTTFDSLDITDCCGGGANVPPDPEMAAGPDHLIAVVNVAFEIYNKTGTVLAGPTTFSSFFSALGGTNCTAGGPFDPNTLYDEEYDRYVIAADGNGRAYCVAVSATSNPTGAWHLYEFATNVSGAFFDYPHAGIGRDAIYMGGNMFNPNFSEARIWAFDKVAMYAGQPAAAVTRTMGSDDTPQPINLHGYQQGTWPTSGPHYILTDRNFNGQTYALHAWTDPFGANTFATLSVFNLPAVHGVTVGMPVNVIQSGGGTIRANDYRPLDFEYRNGRGWSAMTVSCNPGSGTVNCVQWAEIDLGSATLIQTGVFASNGTHRFFPDVAANHCGDMAVGYTKSSGSIFPSVWATGRESSDPLGSLQAEVELKAGEINYTAFDSAPRRWGDYSGMTIDPDGLTFWYLGEYSKITGSAAGRWGNYIASMTFPNCTVAMYGIEMSGPLSDEGAPGSIVTYTLQITNTGDLTDTYDLALSGHSWTTTLSHSEVTLAADEAITVTVTVAIPAGATDGSTDMVTVTATSQGDSNVSAATELTTTAVVPTFLPPEIEVAPAGLESIQLIDTVITHTLTISNVGEHDLDWTIDDSCDAFNNIPWVTFSPAAGTTVAGAASLVDVGFDTNGLTRGVYAGTLCINSNDPATPLVEVPLEVTVVAYGVEMSGPLSDEGAPGSIVTYTLQITNTGDLTDTYDLALSGHSWTTTLSHSEVTLAADEGMTVTVTVAIPAGASDGSTDMATVTATSQGDSNVSAAAGLTTTAVVDTFYIYLPALMRQ